jgi:DNA (cytosine-5)-methyltransferase 1
VAYRQFSPHQFGIPQIRERIYLVGARVGLDEFVWPDTTAPTRTASLRNLLAKNLKTFRPLGHPVVQCIETWQRLIQSIPEDQPLPSFPIWAMEFGATYPLNYDSLWDCPLESLRSSKGAFGRSLTGLSRETIMAGLPRYATYRNNSFPRWKRLFIEQNRAFYKLHQDAIAPHMQALMAFPPSLQKLEWNCQGEARDLWRYVLQFRASGLRVKRPTTAPSLVAMTTTQIPIIAWQRRYMTMRECARLQSMQGLRFLPTGGAAFKALGNAVNVVVARSVLACLLGTSGKKLAVTRTRAA